SSPPRSPRRSRGWRATVASWCDRAARSRSCASWWRRRRQTWPVTSPSGSPRSCARGTGDEREGRVVSHFDTVIFDLDGTISDSAPGILASLQHAFTDTGFAAPPDLVRFIGPPLHPAFVEEGFSEDDTLKLIEV